MSARIVAGTFAAGAAIAAVLVAASLVGSRDTEEEAPATLETTLFAGIPQDDLALGRPDAPRTLVVYEDVQCPYCALWNRDALPGLLGEVGAGNLRLVFHGLAFLGPESELGLRAALAAGMQDRLWDFLDVVYAAQGAENSGWLTEEAVRRFGAAVPGLDVDRLLADLFASEVERAIAAAAHAADAAGVRGTPSFELGPTGGPLELVAADDLDALLAR